jgi:hypothetical protein
MPDALIYTSRAMPLLTEAVLDGVLVRSRTANALRGLTGVLMRRDALIVHYLEGEAGALERTMARIAASPLHGDIALLARSHGVQRVFDGFPLAFHDFAADPTARGAAAWTGALQRVEHDAPRNTPAQLLLTHWLSMART